MSVIALVVLSSEFEVSEKTLFLVETDGDEDASRLFAQPLTTMLTTNNDQIIIVFLFICILR